MSETKQYRSGQLIGFEEDVVVTHKLEVPGHVLVEIVSNKVTDERKILCFRQSGDFRWEIVLKNPVRFYLDEMQWDEAFKTVTWIDSHKSTSLRVIDFKSGEIVYGGKYFVERLGMFCPNIPHPIEGAYLHLDRWNSDQQAMIISKTVTPLPGAFLTSLLVHNEDTYVVTQSMQNSDSVVDNILCFAADGSLKWKLKSNPSICIAQKYHWLYWNNNLGKLMATTVKDTDGFYLINPESGLIEGIYSVPLDLG